MAGRARPAAKRFRLWSRLWIEIPSNRWRDCCESTRTGTGWVRDRRRLFQRRRCKPL